MTPIQMPPPPPGSCFVGGCGSSTAGASTAEATALGMVVIVAVTLACFAPLLWLVIRDESLSLWRCRNV